MRELNLFKLPRITVHTREFNWPHTPNYKIKAVHMFESSQELEQYNLWYVLATLGTTYAAHCNCWFITIN